MKIRSSGNIRFLFAASMALAIIVTGCEKTSTPPPNAPGATTVAGIIQNATDATVFASALAKVHLDTVLTGQGPYTVFVPTNAAFINSGINDLSGYSDDSLKNLLSYHIIAGVGLLSTNFPTGPNAKIVVANGDSVFVTANSTGVYVNGIGASNSDILASNGVIFAMSGVLLPPRGTLMQLLQADTTFSYLVAAIARASQADVPLGDLLSTGAPYTLFAATNNGFRAVGFNSIDSINNTDPDKMANIIKYNILPARMFTSDVTSGQTRPALNDSLITFTSAIGVPQIHGIGNSAPSNVTAVNIMAHNGVLFVIDRLLLPTQQ